MGGIRKLRVTLALVFLFTFSCSAVLLTQAQTGTTTYIAGVRAGDWFEYSASGSGLFPYTNGSFDVGSLEKATLTVDQVDSNQVVTYHWSFEFSNGTTTVSSPWIVDVEKGVVSKPEGFYLPGLLVTSSNLKTGDHFFTGQAYENWYVNTTITTTDQSSQYQLLIMQSPAMEPTIPNGNFVMVDRTINPSDLKIGDIAVFREPIYQKPDSLLVHRIVNITTVSNNRTFQVQGDNNSGPYPITIPANQIYGKVIANFKAGDLTYAKALNQPINQYSLVNNYDNGSLLSEQDFWSQKTGAPIGITQLYRSTNGANDYSLSLTIQDSNVSFQPVTPEAVIVSGVVATAITVSVGIMYPLIFSTGTEVVSPFVASTTTQIASKSSLFRKIYEEYFKKRGSKYLEKHTFNEQVKVKPKKHLLTAKEILIIAATTILTILVTAYVKSKGPASLMSLMQVFQVDAFLFLSLIPAAIVAVLICKIGGLLIDLIYARSSRVFVEFRFWLTGTGTYLLSGLVFLLPFSAPGILRSNKSELDTRTGAIITSSKILVNYALMVPFALLIIVGEKNIGEMGMLALLPVLCSSLIPAEPMPGTDIWKHDYRLSILAFIGSFALMYCVLSFTSPWIVWIELAIGALLGVVGGVIMIKLKSEKQEMLR